MCLYSSNNCLKTSGILVFTQHDNFDSPPPPEKGAKLSRFQRRNQSCSAGFTLIELLVVAGVIVLLTSIILTSLRSFKDKAQDARIMAGTAQVRNIAEAIQKDYNSYSNLCSNGTLNEEAPPPYGEQLSALENDIKIRQGGTINIGCQASFNSYCLDVNLISSDRGRYCIDDEGNTITTSEAFSCSTATATCR
jgi:prepilin-type N-terminal cleavage/methylation domain-containing protein